MSQAGGKAAILLALSAALATLVSSAEIITSTGVYQASLYTPNGDIKAPRSVIRDDSGDILVLSQEGKITAIYQDAENAVKSNEIFSDSKLELTHGLAYSNGFVYASSAEKVFRWPYTGGKRTAISEDPTEVVTGMPSGSGYKTRSLVMDADNNLYVSVGTDEDISEAKDRAEIRKFDLGQPLPQEYESGKVHAKGVRNAVGLTLDSSDTLWAADCGIIDLSRDDLGTSLNTANEIIRISNPEQFYGYPSCWTVDDLAGYQKGLQLSTLFPEGGSRSDAWCLNQNNNVPPTLSLQAHSAPLGLTFYDGIGCESQADSFSCSLKGDLFVALHGSSNPESGIGYKVVRIEINKDNLLPTGATEEVIFQIDLAKCRKEASNCFRPVDLEFNANGHLIISSDTTNDIIRVTKKTNDDNGGSEDVIIILKKSLHVPGIIALAVIAFITTCLAFFLVKRYCCQRAESVPYSKEQI